MNRLTLLAPMLLLLSACGQIADSLPDLGGAYQLKTVAVNDPARPTALVVTPADGRLKLTLSDSSGAIATDARLASDGSAPLGRVCPGTNTYTYTLKTASATVAEGKTLTAEYDAGRVGIKPRGEPLQIDAHINTSATGSNLHFGIETTGNTELSMQTARDLAGCQLRVQDVTVTGVVASTSTTGTVTSGTLKADVLNVNYSQDGTLADAEVNLLTSAVGDYTLTLTAKYRNGFTLSRNYLVTAR